VKPATALLLIAWLACTANEEPPPDRSEAPIPAADSPSAPAARASGLGPRASAATPLPLPDRGFDHAQVFGHSPAAATRLWGRPVRSQSSGAQTLLSWTPPGYRVGVFYDAGVATAITVGLPGVCAARRTARERDREQVAGWAGWSGRRCRHDTALPANAVVRFELYGCGFRIDVVSGDICERSGQRDPP
jgi:hypothetical protein